MMKPAPATATTSVTPLSHPHEDGSIIAVEFGAHRGSYRYVTDHAAAEEAIEWMLESVELSTLSRGMVVGVDIETTSLKPVEGRIRLVQLAAGDRAVVIDAFAFDPWDLIRTSLIELRPDWIAHNAEFEQSWFARHAQFTLTPMFDTRWVYIRERARRDGARANGSSSLQAVCEDLMNFELSKEQRLSDWTAPVLSKAQIEYAALDALVLPLLRQRLERDAVDSGWTAEIDAAVARSLEEAERFAA